MRIGVAALTLAVPSLLFAGEVSDVRTDSPTARPYAGPAGDNVLNLPSPRDPRRPGAVMLHGGGSIGVDVFDRFLELAGGRQARIVFVPSAGFGPSGYDLEEDFVAVVSSRYSSWARLAERGRVRSFQFLYTDDPADADDPAFVRPLEKATGVWFSGGWQSRLNYRFVGRFPQQSRFQTALRSVLERGGAVGGTSAGMAVLPEIMTMWEDREYVSSPATAVVAHGLGLFNGAIVEQHFDAKGGRLERFTSLLRDTARLDALSGRRGAGASMLGLAVDEGAALVVRGDQLEVVGEGKSHVFVKTGARMTWYELENAAAYRLKKDRAAVVVEQIETSPPPAPPR